jgi:deazaflavin-dependent oxidoreductase (nitroreductase family)
MLEKRPNALNLLLQKVPASPLGSWIFSRVLPPIDRFVFWLTRGSQTLGSLAAGVPVILLTTKGAKSGKLHTVPLLATPDGARLTLIASNWGQARVPSWYYNLKANPQVTVQADGVERVYVAHEVQGEEYEALWAKAVALYPGYALYKARAGRHIPVVVLTDFGSG